MSCPHTETTAVLAAFGEAPKDFGNHLQQCADCRRTVEQHTGTLAAMDGAIQPVITQRVRQWPAWAAGALLAAAAVLLAISTTNIGADPTRTNIDSPIAVTPLPSLDTPLPFQSSLDNDLSNLELELALLDLE